MKRFLTGRGRDTLRRAERTEKLVGEQPRAPRVTAERHRNAESCSSVFDRDARRTERPQLLDERHKSPERGARRLATKRPGAMRDGSVDDRGNGDFVAVALVRGGVFERKKEVFYVVERQEFWASQGFCSDAKPTLVLRRKAVAQSVMLARTHSFPVKLHELRNESGFQSGEHYFPGTDGSDLRSALKHCLDACNERVDCFRKGQKLSFLGIGLSALLQLDPALRECLGADGDPKGNPD